MERREHVASLFAPRRLTILRPRCGPNISISSISLSADKTELTIFICSSTRFPPSSIAVFHGGHLITSIRGGSGI